MKRLSSRLLVSHLAVAAVGSGVTFALVAILAPRDFAERTGMRTDQGHGQGPMGIANTAVMDAFDAAVNQALMIGFAVAVIVAGVLAVVSVRRLLAPLEQIRLATRALARGDYSLRIDEPREAELGALALDVNLLAAAIEDSEQRRVRLLGEVAHEMRTPLTVIDGYVEGMIDGVFPADVARLSAVSEETRVLGRLAEDLSALSRSEEGRLELEFQKFDLASLVASAAERLRGQFEHAGVDLTVEQSESTVVTADQVRIAQIITNLLGNALRACAPGGAVNIGLAVHDSAAHVTVTDDGRGLSQPDLARVFERFYRVPETSGERRGTGTGIGLTISRSIARAHGGDVTATSAGLGHGASFTLTLPL